MQNMIKAIRHVQIEIDNIKCKIDHWTCLNNKKPVHKQERFD